MDKAVADLRESAATFEVVTDRPAADDDHVTVNYRGQDSSSPASQPTEAKEAVVHLGGKHTVPAFTENLRGAKTGEVKEFPVTYPADYPQKTLAGKTFSYRVEIQSIKRKVVPPADDELAKSVSEFATLEELRTKLRQDLEEDAQAARGDRTPNRSWRRSSWRRTSSRFPRCWWKPSWIERSSGPWGNCCRKESIRGKPKWIGKKSARMPGPKPKRKSGWRWS